MKAAILVLPVLALLFVTPTVAAERTAVPPIEDVDLLALDLEIARFLVKHVSPKLEPEARVRAVTDALFSKKGLGITYEDSGTKTAVETFESGSGNCLSFTVLFVAMARHLGLNAYFQEVAEVMSWDRRGDIILRNHHMLVEVEVENAHIGVDFLPGSQKRYRKVRRVDDARVLAHYYNNLGVENLAAGGVELSLAYFEKALEADPSFAHAWTNQGVAYRHLGDFDRAEASHKRAIELDARVSSAVANLASLYLATGRQTEAEPLLREVEADLLRNPFYHFRLGSVAARGGDANAAIRHFRAAIRRSPKEAEFHASLAEVLMQEGEASKAAESLRRALGLAEGDAQEQQRLREALATLEDRNQTPW